MPAPFVGFPSCVAGLVFCVGRIVSGERREGEGQGE